MFLPMLASLLSSPAGAQDTTTPGFDAHGFHTAPSDGDLLDMVTLWRTERQGTHAFGLEALVQYADDLLVLTTERADGTRTRTPLLDRLTTLDVAMTYAPHERVAIAVGMPLHMSSLGPNGAQGFALGDLRVSVPVGLLLGRDGTDRGFGVSVVPWLDIPTGDTDKALGTRRLTGGATVPFGYTWGERGALFANLGFTWMTARPSLGLNGGPQLVAGLGGSVQFLDAIALRGELLVRPVLGRTDVPWIEAPGEAILSARYRAPFGLTLTLGGSAGITRGVSAPAYRVFGGLGFVVGKKDRDLDNDRFLNANDPCPQGAEVYNGWKDEDGCPDDLARLAVRVVDLEGEPVPGARVLGQGEALLGETGPDGTLVIDRILPEQTARLRAERARMEDARPVEVDLVEGDNPVELTMAWLPGRVRIRVDGPDGPIDTGVASFVGPTPRAPLRIEDGALTLFLAPGRWSVLVSAPGLGTQRRDIQVSAVDRELLRLDVTLAEARVVVSSGAVELSEQIFFATGDAIVEPSSYPLLDEVASVLLAHPEILELELQGHTDDQGPATANRMLSQRRVDAVKAYLVGSGVDPDRLVARGYGEERPIASNDSEAGRALNRRVEIAILQQEAPVEVQDTSGDGTSP